MATAAQPAEAEGAPVDRAALRLMLSYVEAECRRLGALDAAVHAALAASLMRDVGQGMRGSLGVH